MLAHNKLGPIREEKTLREALAEYERIEREDAQVMRLDEKARASDKERGNELESALSVRNLALLGRHCRHRGAAAHRKPRRAFPLGLSEDG